MSLSSSYILDFGKMISITMSKIDDLVKKTQGILEINKE
jgi:hypothetical protein